MDDGCLIEEGVFLGRNRVLIGLEVVVVVDWVLAGRDRSLLLEGLKRDLERERERLEDC